MRQPHRVLKRETVDTMLTPVLNDYGLGFGVQETDGQASFAHGGSNRGFRCVCFAAIAACRAAPS